MYEYPPILTGSEQQQLLALRDYLVRLAKSLDTAAQTPPEETKPKRGFKIKLILSASFGRRPMPS